MEVQRNYHLQSEPPPADSRNWKNPDKMAEARICKPKCREKSAPFLEENSSLLGRMKSVRSPTPKGFEKRREFLTGRDYKTKFMREMASESKKKFVSSVRYSSQSAFRTDSGLETNWRHCKSTGGLSVQQGKKHEDPYKSISEVTTNQPKTFLQSEVFQAKNYLTKLRMKTTSVSHSNSKERRKHEDTKSTNFESGKPKCGGKFESRKGSKNNESAMSFEQATPSCNRKEMAVDTTENAVGKIGLLQNETINAKAETNEKRNCSPPGGPTDESKNESIYENLSEEAYRHELCIQLPNCPRDYETRGSVSLHTTPRSPRLGKRNLSNSALNSDMCQPQNLSSSRPDVHRSPQIQGTSKKHTFLQDSDTAFGSQELSNNSSFCDKQEPTVFTAQLTSVLRWTDNTVATSTDQIEPNLNDVFVQQLPAVSQEGDISSYLDLHDGKVSNLSSTGKCVNGSDHTDHTENTTHSKPANEDIETLHPSFTNLKAEKTEDFDTAELMKYPATHKAFERKEAFGVKAISNETRSHSYGTNHDVAIAKPLEPTVESQTAPAISLHHLMDSCEKELISRPQTVRHFATKNRHSPSGNVAKRPVSSSGTNSKVKQPNTTKRALWK